MSLRLIGIVAVVLALAGCGGPALLSVDDVVRRLDLPGRPAVSVILGQRDLPAGVPILARIEPEPAADGNAAFSVLVFASIGEASRFADLERGELDGERVRNAWVLHRRGDDAQAAWVVEALRDG